MESAESKTIDVISSFDSFCNHYLFISKERDELFEKNNGMINENKRLQKSNEQFERDVTGLHEMIGNFNQYVTEIDTLKERNKELKDKCEAYEKDSKIKERELEKRLEQLKKDSEDKLNMLIQSKEKDAAAERQRTEALLEDKNAEISHLKDLIAKAKKEKEDEITVLSMKYETKLAKIQQQKSEIMQSNQETAIQQIFRKKLQHLKMTHEEELSALKQQIRLLQEQAAAVSLPNPNQRTNPSPARPNSFSAAFGTRSKRV